ncbi:hypothetical protein BFV94_0674 [Alteromonas macleodii]|uniref:Uncharacterized protein n=1 Tax=Alteromonas macleodii TaxID=28108 RepID=A0AB36FUB7_ALTMA|nr:hypothetical protein BFV95_0672 [Alteromonas macleodii]OES34786.1 hypothetical protein BFV94_0674 [Alteromonas macleodii]OES36318.1 hypothetical protein BFV93_0673 [Alteromonas macleodii]OES42734.1 hypothetical protein BFV96_0674 [Alteromonas macleodii]
MPKNSQYCAFTVHLPVHWHSMNAGLKVNSALVKHRVV